jgi:ribosomal protein L11 methyltransferase
LEQLIEPAADAVSQFAADHGWSIEAYYREAPDPAGLSARLAELLSIAPPVISAEIVPDENWVELSQAALPPVAAGRFIIHGSHDRLSVPRGLRTIEIDAGEAFGTAHHATTLGCLIAIDRLAQRQTLHRVLDLGCGSGVLAIAAQRAWPRASITALDSDPAAVSVAAANVRRNGALRIGVRLAGGAPGPRLPGTRCDLVLANILAGPLIAMAPVIAAAVAPGGTLVLSGLLAMEARHVKASYLARAFALVRESCMAGWTTLTLVRRRIRTKPRTVRRGHLWRAPPQARDRARAADRR